MSTLRVIEREMFVRAIWAAKGSVGNHSRRHWFGGFVGLVVDKPEKAKKVFASAHMHYTEQPVLHIELANTPGALARFAVSKEGINMTAAYEASVRGAKTASVVL